jgi:hypothetical protein
VSEQDKSMTFAGDIPQDGTAQFMKTNVDSLVDGAADAAEASLIGLGEERPELALLVSCVGRKLVMKQRIEEEIEAIRGVFGADTSIAGFTLTASSVHSAGGRVPAAQPDHDYHNLRRSLRA